MRHRKRWPWLAASHEVNPDSFKTVKERADAVLAQFASLKSLVPFLLVARHIESVLTVCRMTSSEHEDVLEVQSYFGQAATVAPFVRYEDGTDSLLIATMRHVRFIGASMTPPEKGSDDIRIFLHEYVGTPLTEEFVPPSHFGRGGRREPSRSSLAFLLSRRIACRMPVRPTISRISTCLRRACSASTSFPMQCGPCGAACGARSLRVSS